MGSFDTKEEAALQRALALQGTVEVCSPAARGPRSAGSLHARLARVRALYSHTCAILATGVKSEASCEVLGELSANLITDPAAALQAGPRCACGHQWRHLRCGGCGRATAHNPASAHFANFPDEATREEAIYAEDMTAVDADIAQLQRERLCRYSEAGGADAADGSVVRARRCEGSGGVSACRSMHVQHGRAQAAPYEGV